MWCQAPCLQVCLKCVLVGVPLIAMHLAIVEGLLSEAATCIGLARAWENGERAHLFSARRYVRGCRDAMCQRSSKNRGVKGGNENNFCEQPHVVEVREGVHPSELEFLRPACRALRAHNQHKTCDFLV